MNYLIYSDAILYAVIGTVLTFLLLVSMGFTFLIIRSRCNSSGAQTSEVIAPPPEQHTSTSPPPEQQPTEHQLTEQRTELAPDQQLEPDIRHSESLSTSFYEFLQDEL